jgi:hypothetical protein
MSRDGFLYGHYLSKEKRQQACAAMRTLVFAHSHLATPDGK